MKVYFSTTCYFDSDKKELHKDDKLVTLTDQEKFALACLIDHNKETVSHADLYRAIYPKAVNYRLEKYKKEISMHFSGKGALYSKIPSLRNLLTIDKHRYEGGYRLDIPTENFIGEKHISDQAIAPDRTADKLRVSQKKPNGENTSVYINELKEMADNGDVKAAYEYAMMCFYGFIEEENHIIRDYQLAYEYYKKVIDNDQGILRASALRMIGHMYYNGRLPTSRNENAQSYQEAFKYISQSAEFFTSAKQHIGYMLSIGSGCNFDYQKAKDYYLSFIDNADISGILHFANFLNSHGDYELAVKYYKKILDETDNPEAAYQLGMIYKNGTHVSPPVPDYSLAEEFLVKCEESERYRARAYYEIGMLYFNPTGQFRKNFQKAARYFQKASKDEHTLSNYMLGYMYENGHIRTDYEKAISYYLRAAEHDHVMSALNLSYLYLQIADPNYSEALRWAKWAADQRNADACFAYANMLFLGRGCQRDLRTALRYYELAANHGLSDAVYMKEELEKLR